MSCTAEDLAQDIWVQILQHVPCKESLSACALVCHKLARAAAAATMSVELDATNSPQHTALLGWTSSHGSSLTKLTLRSRLSHSSIRQLPCPNQLDLSYCSVQLCAGSEHLGLLHSCTALTKLVVSRCTLMDGGVDGPTPAAVAQLKHFSCSSLDSVQLDRELAQALENRLLPHLTSLKCLDLDFRQTDTSFRMAAVPACFCQHISSMAGLQQLSLVRTGPVSASTLPGIERLTALESLPLLSCKLEPSCLLRMTTSLTEFKLQNVTLQPEQAQHDSALGASQLLQLLGQLTALRTLTLLDIDGEWPQQLSAHSALTASSNLQALQVCGCSVQGAAWAHVFPAGRKLPHLRSLQAYNHTPGWDSSFTADIASLVSCCPALETVDIAPSLTASLAPLKSLTALTSLRLGPVLPTAVANLTALTQLRDLQLYVVGAETVFGVRGLLPLMALKGLTRLRCDAACEQLQGEGVEEEQEHPRYMFEPALELGQQHPAGAPSHVWVQLLEHCEADLELWA